MVNKDVQFIMKNNKVKSPLIVTDGLELYYDVKGKKNTDNHKGKLLDMSGNGRHGTLRNFAYWGISGFVEKAEGGLLLDNLDDKIIRPYIDGLFEVDSTGRENLIADSNTSVLLSGNFTWQSISEKTWEEV